MAEGIRLVSVRRGEDPRRFSLLAFGGAAGLHVTEVARLLEITRVVVPRVAAVLSAWGMLATDLRYELVRTCQGLASGARDPAHGRSATRTTGKNAQDGDAAMVRLLFDEMEMEGRSRLGASFTGPVAVRRSVDMRYGEQIFEIQVPLDGLDVDAPDLMDRIVDRFHQRHEELYTYSAPDQDVVLVNARVAVVGVLPVLPSEPGPEATTSPSAPVHRRAYLGGWVEVPVYDLDSTSPGLDLKGPAIFESATTTVVLRQGESATITPHGWLDIRLG
jgi:N-methylhydantoinase A